MAPPTNKTQADRAERALETYRGIDIVDESHIQDIISDILHLAVRRKLDPTFFGRAVRNFEAEVRDKKWQAWSSRAGEVLRSLEEWWEDSKRGKHKS